MPYNQKGSSHYSIACLFRNTKFFPMAIRIKNSFSNIYSGAPEHGKMRRHVITFEDFRGHALKINSHFKNILP